MNRRTFFKLLAGAAAATALKPLVTFQTEPELLWPAGDPYIDPTVMNVFNAGYTFVGVPTESTERWERWSIE